MPQVLVNGADIYYEESGAGAPLLLLHGMLETGREFARLILLLGTHYHVIAPDLRGYGRSGPRPRTFPPDFYARDAADMLAFLAHLKLDGVIVMGVADGAEAALLMAIQAPARIRAVVGISVAGAFPPNMAEVLPKIGSWVDDPVSANQGWRSEVIREYGLDGVHAMWVEWKAAIRTILADGGDISRRQAGTIRCPVLLINGTDDRLNTPEMSQALADAIPDAELHLIQDVDQIRSDRYTRHFRDLLLDWLARH